MTIKERATSVYAAIGLPGVLLLALVALALLWFAYGGVASAWDSYWATREIEKLKQEADAQRQRADAAEAEANQYKGAAAAYKQQAEQVQNELTELFNARPELQKQTAAAQRRVQEIRNRPLVPVGDNVRQRVDDLGAKLDGLYPEPR